MTLDTPGNCATLMSVDLWPCPLWRGAPCTLSTDRLTARDYKAFLSWTLRPPDFRSVPGASTRTAGACGARGGRLARSDYPARALRLLQASLSSSAGFSSIDVAARHDQSRTTPRPQAAALAQYDAPSSSCTVADVCVRGAALSGAAAELSLAVQVILCLFAARCGATAALARESGTAVMGDSAVIRRTGCNAFALPLFSCLAKAVIFFFGARTFAA